MIDASSLLQILKAAQAKKVAAKLIQAGLAKEIKAKPGAPVWRQDAPTGQSFALKLTVGGVKAIAVDNRSVSDGVRDENGEHEPVAAVNSEIVRQTSSEDLTMDGARPSGLRDGTRLARVLGLLQRDCGATLEELIAATGWLPHTRRAALTGLRKRSYAVTIDRSDKEPGSTYRARSDETIDLAQAGSQSDDPPRIPAARNSKSAQRSEEPQAQQAA